MSNGSESSPDGAIVRYPRRVWLSLGSNLGDRRDMIEQALTMIARLPGTALGPLSHLYETAPIGITDQPSFLNLAAGVDTTLEAGELLRSLKMVEETIGRQARGKWREREIDIDILLDGERTVDDGDLHLPHPRMTTRRFVLLPLAEIAPDVRHPVTHETISELLRSLPTESEQDRVVDRGALSTYQTPDTFGTDA